MYNVNRQNIHDVKSTIYISKKLGTMQDNNLNEYEIFSNPIKYRFNVQVISSDSEIREFGELANDMLVISITEKTKYLFKFMEFDRVYINTTPDGELHPGDNADYRIYSIRNQNTSIRIYIRKLVK